MSNTSPLCPPHHTQVDQLTFTAQRLVSCPQLWLWLTLASAYGVSAGTNINISCCLLGLVASPECAAWQHTNKESKIISLHVLKETIEYFQVVDVVLVYFCRLEITLVGIFLAECKFCWVTSTVCSCLL